MSKLEIPIKIDFTNPHHLLTVINHSDTELGTKDRLGRAFVCRCVGLGLYSEVKSLAINNTNSEKVRDYAGTAYVNSMLYRTKPASHATFIELRDSVMKNDQFTFKTRKYAFLEFVRHCRSSGFTGEIMEIAKDTKFYPESFREYAEKVLSNANLENNFADEGIIRIPLYAEEQYSPKSKNYGPALTFNKIPPSLRFKPPVKPNFRSGKRVPMQTAFKLQRLPPRRMKT